MGTVVRCMCAVALAVMSAVVACPVALSQATAPAAAPGDAEPVAPVAAAAPSSPGSSPEPAEPSVPPVQDAPAAAPTQDAGDVEGEAEVTTLPPAPQDRRQPPAELPCEPACGDGYVCKAGGCVSSCYPPCGFGERCQQGACTSSTADTTTDASGRPAPRWNWAAPPPDRQAAAAAKAPEPGFHEHDGFLLRGFFVLGGGSVEYRRAGRSRSLDGGAFQLGFDIGARLTNNFSLMGRLSLYTLGREVEASSDPGADGGTSTMGDTTSVGLVGPSIGVAAAYYLMPINIYFGSALSIIGGTLQDVDDDGLPETEMQLDGGWVFQLEAVKEWWIGGDWGMGAGLRLSFGGATAVENLPQDDAERMAIEDAGGPLESELNHFSIGLLGSTTFQ